MPTQVPPSRLDSTKDFSSLVPSAFAKANAAFEAANTASGAAATSTPKISSIVYPGNDTAAATAGGQTVTLNGAGFNAGASVLINGSYAGVVSVANSTSLSFTTPSNSGGTYILYVINTDGGTGISVPGISYSGTPSWSNAAGSLATVYETAAVNTQLTATGDIADGTITYSLQSGTLPPGSSLNSSTGLLSGTTQVTENSTTYNFTIRATDGQNQDTDRAFSITISPDVVTWSSPADGTVTALSQNEAMSNVTLSATSAAGQSVSYTANALPTGVTISGSNVTGTPTVLGNTISVITATAANTNRTATRTFTWVVSVANDTFFKNTTLLLNGETTVTPFINDASTNNLALTIQGDTKPVLFNPYTPGYYSNYFDGTGDVLTLASGQFPVLGTNNFTMEAWVYTNSVASGTSGIFDMWNGGTTAFLLRRSSTNLQIYVQGSQTIDSGAILNVNTWFHVAVVRNGTTITLYVNGLSVGTPITSYSTSITGNVALGIGGTATTGNEGWIGYITNARIVNGTAVYTSAFTPPTTPLTAVANTSLLTCQSNRFIDNSTNNFTFTKSGDVSVSSATPFTANSSYSTYGSTYFDGTGDYLTVPGTNITNIFTGDFTIEAWLYPTAAFSSSWVTSDGGFTDIPVMICNASPTSSNYFWAFGPSSTGTVRFITSSIYFNTVTSTATCTVNAWNHLALVKIGTTYKIYVNGVGTAGTTITTSPGTAFSDAAGISIGANNGKYITGYLSNARIVKGTAVYTANFTPPTAPLTAVANTSLLTLQYNGGATNQGIIDNSNFNNIVTRFGNTSQGTFSPYSVTGWSNYFPTTNDWLTITPTSNQAAYGFRGSFTVECWIYADARPATLGYIYLSGRGGGNYLVLTMNSSGFITYSGSSSGARITANTAYVPGTWTHIAVSRTAVFGSSGLVKMFINGVEQSTTYNDGGGDNWTIGSPSYIGNDGNTNYTWPVYISNFRVVTGRAMYTTAFTPPTSPLTFVPVSPVTDVNAETHMVICQSNRSIDNGPNNLAITVNGTPSIRAFGPFGSVPEAVPISYSNFFDGTGDYLTVSGTAISFGTAAYTIEFWIYRTAAPGLTRLFERGTGGTDFSMDLSSVGVLTINNNTTISGSTCTTSIPLNTWTHIALVRTSTSASGTAWYINGVASGTFTHSTNIASGGTLSITTGGLTGYLSNLRIINGTAVYTSAFTPSTTPLTAIANTSLLTCQSTIMIDNSTNNFTITGVGDTKPRIFNPFGYTAQSATSYTPSIHGGSAYFDGTGDRLTVPDNTALESFKDFTIEFWVYYNSVAGTQVIVDKGWNDVSFVPYMIYTTGGNILVYSSSNGSTWDVMSGSSWGAVVPGTWYHIALTRSGSSIRLFKNGALMSTVTNSSILHNNASVLGIGASPAAGGSPLNGYISDLRMVHTAVYTAAFIPPTSSLTPITNTSLLLKFNNGGIIDQHGTNVLETVGNAQLSTAVKKYNNASMYFDGTGDYLTFPPNAMYTLGTGNFTIECWAFASTGATNIGLFQISATAGGFLGGSNSIALSYYYGNVNGYVANTTVTGNSGRFTPNAWHHIAVSRSSGVTRVFIDGLLETNLGTSGAITDTYSYPGTYLVVGGYFSTSYPWLGYIDDFRITKGYARYTSNFTPPSALITK